MRISKKKDSPSTFRKLHWWLLHNGPTRHVMVETKNGKISFDSRDNCVGKHVFFKREYDVDKVQQLSDFLVESHYIDPHNPGLVLNVGANIGLLATALKYFSVFDDIVAFEPVPSNYELLKKNVLQNGLDDSIDCVNLALSSADGEVEMELSEDNYGDHRVRRSDADGKYGESQRATVTVTMNRLDTFMEKRYASSKVGLVWMDIQGHEGDFFIGAKDIILKGKVPTVTEFWPYGMARSGMKQDAYSDLISSMYTHFYKYGDMKRFSVDQLGILFEEYAGPDVSTDIILVNENWAGNQT